MERHISCNSYENANGIFHRAKVNNDKISLVAQWLRLHLPLQAAWVEFWQETKILHAVWFSQKKASGAQKTVYSQCNLEKEKQNESITLLILNYTTKPQ